MPLTEGQKYAVREMVRTWVAAMLQRDVIPYLLVGTNESGKVFVATIPSEMGSDENLLAMLAAAVESLKEGAFDDYKVSLENL